MTNLAQFLLIVVISTLTFLITLVAIQVFQVLHEAKLAIKKFNGLLDNTQFLSEAASKPLKSMNEFFSEVKTLVDSTESEVVSQTPDRVIKEQTPSKRFFHRSGATLRPTGPS